MTIVYPTLPSGHVVFCDDIRYEITGKVTFVGVYGPAMFLTEMPGILHRICCVIYFRISSEVTGKALIRIVNEVEEVDTTLSEIEIELGVGGDPPETNKTRFTMQEARFFAEFSNLTISGSGHLKVRVILDEKEYRIGSLVVDRAPQIDTTKAD
jgi:hypothetical protein